MEQQVYDGVGKTVVTPAQQGAPRVTKGSTVTVHCDACLGKDHGGMKFWSTRDPGQKPFTFQAGVGQVIEGWDQGCLSMHQGEKSTLRIRSDKGYGAGGFPAWKIPPNAELNFTIEILDIK